MFHAQLTKYFTDAAKPSLAIETINSYEFLMAALLINDTWYVLVENADPSRIEDINEVIGEEFQAETVGWRVLEHSQQDVGTTMIEYSQGEKYISALELISGANHYWLLQVRPKIGSRLLAKN